MSKKRINYSYDDYDDYYADDYYGDDYYDDYAEVSYSKPTKTVSKAKAKTGTQQKSFTTKKSTNGSKNRKKLTNDEISFINNFKSTINMITVGHVDAGKSTLTAHLLYKLGYFKNVEIDDNRMIDKQKAKTNPFALLLDVDETERERGVTIDLNFKFIETKDFFLNLIDAPGHQDFTSNVISGVYQSDGAILVVPASKSEFESSFIADGQTKEHTLILRYLGIKRLIIAINKMDNIDYSQERYNYIKQTMLHFLNQSFDNTTKIHFIPLSGLIGENLLMKSKIEQLSWYKGSSLFELISSFSKKTVDKSFLSSIENDKTRFIILNSEKNDKLSGIIVSGCLRKGDNIIIYPQKLKYKIKKLIVNGEAANFVFAGQRVEITLNSTIESLTKHSVITLVDNEIQVTDILQCTVITLETLEEPIIQGSNLIMYINGVLVGCTVIKLIATKRTANADTKDKNKRLSLQPRLVTKNSLCMLEVKLEYPVCFEKFAECSLLGRFILRKDGVTIAAGGIV